MNKLKEYIIEKLIINKNSKVKKSYKPQEILNWLSIFENSCQRWEILYNHVNSWLTDNIKSDTLELCADPETANECKLPKEIKEIINTSLYVNEWCQDQLDKSHKLYFNEFEDIEIWLNNYIICNITQFGTLYVINKTHYENEKS